MKKCSSLWSKASRPKSSEIIFETIGVHLSYPVTTRWNSLFDSLTKILIFKEKLDELCNKLGLLKFNISDINYMDEYCKMMAPVSSSIDFLQGQNIYYGYTLPCLITLRNKFKKILIELTVLKEIAGDMETALLRRFNSYFILSSEVEDAIAATVLCPAVKLSCFPALIDIAGNLKCSTENINAIVIRYAKELQNEASEDSSHSSTLNTMQHNIDSFFDFGLSVENSSVNEEFNSIVETEYYSYLADRNTDIKMIMKYPTLKKLFLKVNAKLTSSAPVERLFSFAGIVNSPRRHALSDSNFERLVLLKANSFRITE